MGILSLKVAYCKHCKKMSTDTRHHKGLCKRMKRLQKKKGV